MQIRDAHAAINGDNAVIEMPSGGLTVVAGDGRELFGIRLAENGSLEIVAGGAFRHAGQELSQRLSIRPQATNAVTVSRVPLPEGD